MVWRYELKIQQQWKDEEIIGLHSNVLKFKQPRTIRITELDVGLTERCVCLSDDNRRLRCMFVVRDDGIPSYVEFVDG